MYRDIIPHPDRLIDREQRRAVVGWTHRPLPHGIEVTIQSAASTVGLENGQVASCHLAMTRNQVLLLTRDLLTAAGYDAADLPLPERRPSWWRRMFGRRGCPLSA